MRIRNFWFRTTPVQINICHTKSTHRFFFQTLENVVNGNVFYIFQRFFAKYHIFRVKLNLFTIFPLSCNQRIVSIEIPSVFIRVYMNRFNLRPLPEVISIEFGNFSQNLSNLFRQYHLIFFIPLKLFSFTFLWILYNL